MLIVTFQRAKCIGCNYCEESAPELFRMSVKDGKAVLLHATEKRGFYTLKTHRTDLIRQALNAEQVCPAKIIKVKK